MNGLGKDFLDIDQKLQTKTEIVYPSVNKQKKIRKEKNIIFVGRLNYSKGYDIFKDAVIKILNNFPTWKAYSLGDEDRRNIYINHPNHKELGFVNHKKTLNIKTTTIIFLSASTLLIQNFQNLKILKI